MIIPRHFAVSAASIFLPVLLVCAGCATAQEKDPAENDYAETRKNMVERQLVTRGIHEPAVLEVMSRVPRHLFVPETYRNLAYEDTPLPIGHDQTISQPFIVALMTELLQPDSLKRVLEIGTGSGYQAAILAELFAEVYSIELIEPLAQSAAALLDSLGHKNVTCKAGDGYLGWPEFAPFDAIIVTCAPPEIPEALIDQLSQDGRMVVPVGDNLQYLKLLTKTESGLDTQIITPVRFVPMLHPDDTGNND